MTADPLEPTPVQGEPAGDGAEPAPSASTEPDFAAAGRPAAGDGSVVEDRTQDLTTQEPSSAAESWPTGAPSPAIADDHDARDEEIDGLMVADAAIDVEDLLDSLEAVTRERDDYLGALQRLQAEFDNFRKRTTSHTEARVQAGISHLVEALLPVLDACDAAVAAGETSVEPIGRQLLGILGKQGLDRIATEGEAFDPTVHEAVLREDGEGDAQVVVEEFRPGYRWAGKVLRPAAVKVRL